ncbi:MAG TPA: hypothetical protein VHS09_13570 [Polyangiaceae bacterium]|nr:hypothetical protein [Polyangiaceae bacterium]
MSKNNSRADLLAADQNMIDGIQKNASKLPASFPVGSVTMTPQDMVTVLQGRITTGKAVVQSEATHAAALQADTTTRDQTKTKVSAFKRIIIAMFLQSPDVLGDFGLAAPKPPLKTAEVKAAAAAKAKATRTLLGTKGAQQKKAAIAAAAAPVDAPAVPATPPALPASPAAPVAASPALPAAAPKPVS